jgi:tripartite-type tricarboxylate transporter receptor subunit TctC
MSIRAGFERRRAASIALVAAGLCAALPAPLRAQSTGSASDYPSRVIKIVCAHAAGGAADQLSRLVAERLTAALGQTVIVENKPGASTMLAAEQVAHAPADGYTLLMATVTTLSINPWFYKKLRYDPIKSFEPVAVVASTPFFLGIAPELPVRNVGDAVRLAKERPGALNYGSSGKGTSSHLAGELFAQMAGTEIVHIPYRATATRNTELAAGTIQMVFGNDLMPLARLDKVRIVGVTSAERLSGYPDIPTIAEAANLPGYEASVWYGLVAPAGTPKPIVERLNSAIGALLQRPEVRDQIMNGLGGQAVGGSAQSFATLIASDLDKWGRVIKQGNLKAEE